MPAAPNRRRFPRSAAPDMMWRMSVAAPRRRLLLALATNERWERAIRAMPGGERLAYRWARPYVAGARLADALARAHRLASEGLASSIDLFGESVADPVEADRVTDEYVVLAAALDQAPNDCFLSIDLSHIGL